MTFTTSSWRLWPLPQPVHAPDAPVDQPRALDALLEFGTIPRLSQAAMGLPRELAENLVAAKQLRAATELARINL